jgi:transglutaminase-like putative cysteine protease
MNVPMTQQSTGRRIGKAAVSAPRIVMSWEDWLTFAAAIVVFLSVAVSIQNAHWVKNMPALVPTALAGLLIGMIAARTKLPGVVLHPLAFLIGVAVVALVVQTYADGATVAERLGDTRMRMREWFDVVRAGDISNDNLPFVTLVHSICFLAAYMASWSIYRWRNPWLATIPAAMVLLANISGLKGQPSGAFIIFLFGSVVLIARLHLQRSQVRWKRQGVEYPDFISMSAIQLTLVLATALVVVAWALPVGNQAGAASSVFNKLTSPARDQSSTFVRLFHNIDAQKGANLHGFGDFLAIQGNVKLGTKDIFEIKAPEAGLVRAQSYEEYTGSGWKTDSRKDTRVAQSDLAATPEGTDYEARNVTTLVVKVLDGESTILTQGIPLGTNLPSTASGPKTFAGEIEQLTSRTGLSDGDTYNSFGSESTATADQLAAAGSDYPQWVTDRYLQLPKSLPQRVRDESARVAADAGSPYLQAKAVEDYLRTFPYDLTVASPPAGRDTVDYFLFDLKRGYFDYQSTAMAVMLRTLGIPARVAVGYALDPDAEHADTTFTVKKQDAYSWVEVFFPKYGWVTFNPTAGRDAGGAGGIGAAASGGFGEDPQNLQDLFPPDDFVNPQPTGPVATALNETPTTHSGPPWTIIWSLAGVLGLVAVAAVSTRFAWNYGLGGIEGRPRLWAKVQRAAGWAGLGTKQGETPREWSRRLGTAIDRESDATQLAAAYEEARYGRPDLQREDDGETATAYKRLRNTLFGKVLRRGR